MWAGCINQPTNFSTPHQLGLAVGSRRMTSALNSFKLGLEEYGPAHLFRLDAESAHPYWMARAAISLSVSSVEVCGSPCPPLTAGAGDSDSLTGPCCAGIGCLVRGEGLVLHSCPATPLLRPRLAPPYKNGVGTRARSTFVALGTRTPTGHLKKRPPSLFLDPELG